VDSQETSGVPMKWMRPAAQSSTLSLCRKFIIAALFGFDYKARIFKSLLRRALLRIMRNLPDQRVSTFLERDLSLDSAYISGQNFKKVSVQVVSEAHISRCIVMKSSRHDYIAGDEGIAQFFFKTVTNASRTPTAKAER
jgi:hypothetical protein